MIPSDPARNLILNVAFVGFPPSDLVHKHSTTESWLLCYIVKVIWWRRRLSSPDDEPHNVQLSISWFCTCRVSIHGILPGPFTVFPLHYIWWHWYIWHSSRLVDGIQRDSTYHMSHKARLYPYCESSSCYASWLLVKYFGTTNWMITRFEIFLQKCNIMV